MNAEMQSKLAKYMQENGYYNAKQIRIDEGMSERSAKFMDIFGGADEDAPEQRSELLAAAIAYNEAKSDAAQQVEQAQVDTVLSAETVDFEAAEAAGLTVNTGDGDIEPYGVELKQSAQERRNELTEAVEITVSEDDNEFEIGDLTIRCQFPQWHNDRTITVFGWNNSDTSDSFGDFEVEVAQIEIRDVDYERVTDRTDEEYTFTLTRKQVSDALTLYNETYMTGEDA